MLYDNVYIVKPKTSRAANSEKYIIRVLPFNIVLLQWLIKILKENILLNGL